MYNVNELWNILFPIDKAAWVQIGLMVSCILLTVMCSFRRAEDIETWCSTVHKDFHAKVQLTWYTGLWTLSIEEIIVSYKVFLRKILEPIRDWKKRGKINVVLKLYEIVPFHKRLFSDMC